jgi:hypothetical protein
MERRRIATGNMIYIQWKDIVFSGITLFADSVGIMETSSL